MQPTITLSPVDQQGFDEFKTRMQASFTDAAKEAFPDFGEVIPPERDIEESLANEGAQMFNFVCEGKVVGGAIVSGSADRMLLDFIFIDTAHQNQHLGLAAWTAIESAFPQVKVWELVTPYHERRNIHFYVNKCGFKIVEYFNKYHSDPHFPEEEAGDYPGEDGGLFRFEKVRAL